MLHQTSLLSLAAAAVLLSNGASADSGVRPHHARSRAAHVVARSNTMPDGWSLTAACLTDAAVPNRLLKQSTNFMDTLTPALCASTCAADGFVYAAVQDGHECWCGSTLNKSATTGVKADVSQCNWACPGDASQTCGGYYHLTLYSSISSGNIYSSYSHKLHSSTVKSSETHSATESINPSSSVAHVASTTTKSATTSTPSVGTSKYKLVENISGSSFFSHFDFFTAADPTNGLVTFVSSSVANSSGLVEYKDGQAIMRVDATTQLGANQNRKSVRVTSKNAYKTGLMVFDVAAMPYGCAVWPAMWTVGPNWPNGAEIDIIEGVNNAKVNQLTLHTGESTSCSTSAVSTEAVSTNFMNKQCASSETADAGCGYQDTSAGAYGAGFNAAGGAVYALLIDANAGTTIWVFPRNKGIPADITAGQPNPSSSAWGTPAASWPSSSGCKTGDVIQAQNIVFDITLCGGWTNSDYPNSGCPGTCAEQVQNPSNFNNAVWKVNGVKVYQ